MSNSLQPPWTVAHQAPLSMGFSRQEYWSGLPFPSPGDLPNPGVQPGSPALWADSLPSEPPGKGRWVNVSVAPKRSQTLRYPFERLSVGVSIESIKLPGGGWIERKED